uniref:Uncharacterized protein LOC113797743 n=1 Tax=Dermatophagoides pteronyssinus TaxID=6956 RepID=A0A6P6YFF7_DERPT|nr:uncharacterized protein LOC113797743 [Dermatophagoides pteronyssinus]
MPRFPRFTYRFIRFIIIFIIIFSLFIICFYSYHWYDLEMVQKNYVKQIIKLSITNDHDQQQSLLTLNVDDIHRNLIKIYHQQPQQTNRLSPSAIDQYWSMAKNFNLTEENFGEWKKSFTGGGDDVRIRQDFPQSFFGTILGYHLKIASSLDKILRLNYPENLTIDKLIDERRQQGWITNLKLNEFQPITFLNFGAKICESKSLGFDLEALIFVITAPDDFELRSVIRQTWARKFQENSRQIRLYFAIGYSRYSQHHQQLQIEQEYYQYYDLIQWPFIENYNRLSIKSMALIRWSAIYCPMVKNIYKIDGDSLVNYDNFMKFIMKINNDYNERQTKTTNVNTLKLSAYGNIRYPQAIRFWSKFATSFDDYPYVYYPKYTDASWMLSGGPGNSLLTYATGILETMPALPWEDVLITGLIPQRMQNNHHIDYKHYYFPGYNDRIKINEIDNCKFQMSIIFTHKFNQYNLQRIWKSMNIDCTLPGLTLNDTFSLGIVDDSIIQYNYDDSISTYSLQYSDHLFRLINGRLSKIEQIFPVLIDDDHFNDLLKKIQHKNQLSFAVQQSLMEPLYIYHLLFDQTHQIILQSSTGNNYYFVDEQIPNEEYDVKKLIPIWSADMDMNIVLNQINYLMLMIDEKHGQTFVFDSIYLQRKPYGLICFVPNTHHSKLMFISYVDKDTKCESTIKLIDQIDFAFLTKQTLYLVSIQQQNVYQISQSLFYFVNTEKDMQMKPIKDVFSCHADQHSEHIDTSQSSQSSKKRITKPDLNLNQPWYQFIIKYKLIIIVAIFLFTFFFLLASNCHESGQTLEDTISLGIFYQEIWQFTKSHSIIRYPYFHERHSSGRKQRLYLSDGQVDSFEKRYDQLWKDSHFQTSLSNDRTMKHFFLALQKTDYGHPFMTIHIVDNQKHHVLFQDIIHTDSYNTLIRLQHTNDDQNCGQTANIFSTIRYGFIVNDFIFLVTANASNVYLFDISVFFTWNLEKKFYTKKLSEIIFCEKRPEGAEDYILTPPSNDDTKRIWKPSDFPDNPDDKKPMALIILGVISIITILIIIGVVIYGSLFVYPKQKNKKEANKTSSTTKSMDDRLTAGQLSSDISEQPSTQPSQRARKSTTSTMSTKSSRITSNLSGKSPMTSKSKASTIKRKSSSPGKRSSRVMSNN